MKIQGSSFPSIEQLQDQYFKDRQIQGRSACAGRRKLPGYSVNKDGRDAAVRRSKIFQACGQPIVRQKY